MMTRNKQWRLFAAGAIVALTGTLLPACPATKSSNCKNPKYVPSLKDQAIQYYQNNNLIEALRILTETEQCKPRDPEIYYLMGMIYYKRDRPAEAIDAFKKAIAVDNRYMDAYMALGVVYLSLNRWDEAILQFERAASDDFFPRPWEAYNNLAWAYLQKGDLDLAEVNANNALRLQEQWCPAYCTLGEVYSKKGLKHKAIKMHLKAIEYCKDSYARPYFLLGLEYGEMGYIDKACESLAKAAGVKNAPEAKQAHEYMTLYNCPGVLQPPRGQ
jgi:tetratricopeptide (TPR) repeat protein